MTEVQESMMTSVQSYNYLVNKHGDKNIPIKKDTFIRLCYLEQIPCSFRTGGNDRTRRYFKKEAIDEWYEKSTGQKL